MNSTNGGENNTDNVQEEKELVEQNEELEEEENDEQEEKARAGAQAVANASKKKEEFKFGLKATIKRIIRKVIIGAIIFVLLAGFAWAVISGILNSISDAIKNIGNLFTPTSAEELVDLSEGINITDDKLEGILAVIKENGLTLDDLFLSGDTLGLDEDSEEYKNELMKYLRQFLLAQVCTEYPDFGIEEDETHFNGIIKVRRAASTADSVDEARDMTYVRKDIFEAMVKAINQNTLNIGEGSELLVGYTLESLKAMIKTYYSIDNNGNLFFANDVKTTIIVEGVVVSVTYEVSIQSINYKTVVEKYSMPMQAILSLCEITQNPQYVYEFIEDFILAGHIDITILDNFYTDTYNSWYDYQITKVVNTYTRIYDEMDGWSSWIHSSTQTTYPEFLDRHHYTKIVERTEGTAKVTDVDTWMVKVNFTYSNKKDNIEYPLGQEKVVEDCDLPDPLPENTTTSSDTVKVETKYSFGGGNYSHFVQTETLVYNLWNKDKQEVDEVAIERKAKNIVAQWDEYFKLPNDNKKTQAGPMIVSGQEMFLELLNREETQNQREIYKYLLYIYTNGLYGESSFDKSLYEDNEFMTYTVGSEDIIVHTGKGDASMVLTKDEIEKAIKACYSGQIRSNLLSAVDAFYSIQNKYNVNATFAIAMTIAESSGGTNWNLISSETHNWYSIKGSYRGSSYTDKNGTKWRKYSSFSVATDDFADLIANGKYYFRAGNYTVRTIMQKYNMGNESEIKNILTVMRRLYSSLGKEVSTVGGTGDGSENSMTYDSETVAKVMEEAKKHIGKPYVFGAKGPNSFDCSGFVSYALKKAGVLKAGYSAQGLYNVSTKISASEAKVGDLIFFTKTYNTSSTVTHVGFYCGNGKMLDASGNSVGYHDLTKSYWKTHLYGYGRVIK